MEPRHPDPSSTNQHERYTDEQCSDDSISSSDCGENGDRHTGQQSRRLTPSGKVMRNLRLLAALAHSIRKRRLAHQITQDELAHATGLDRSYIVSIEKGKRNISITKLVQIAAELGLSASQLLRLAEEQLEDRI
jgi:DNA-binding XRE family transcriptional regulator